MALSIPARAKWSPVQRYLELLHILVERNLKGRYRGSFLGVYWSLLNPLIMTGIYTAIFGAAFKSFYGGSTINYMLAAFTGLIVINFFSAATNQALASVVGSGPLMNKIRLPITVFPLSMIVSNVFQFVVGPLPLLAIITFHKSWGSGWWLVNTLCLLLPLLSLSLVCAGVGYLVSALYVFFRDLPYFYELVCFVLWIGSPIFYPVEIVPKPVQAFLIINPLMPIIESIRQLSLNAERPDLLMIGHGLLNGIILLAIGWSCFRAWQNQFMDLL
ncbi:ABC transporter permease [Synechocystis sp. LKSZ1]|uniref:ABC transporter permease n=1 Tax=Synechocystis sp. LKSZ1 TaxID=3144951 RepID=UPI00336BDC2B